MAILIQCDCGCTFSVGEQFFGLSADCPKCNRPLTVGWGEADPSLRILFQHDRFKLGPHPYHPKKFCVRDETGMLILHVHPTRHRRPSLGDCLWITIASLLMLAACGIFYHFAPNGTLHDLLQPLMVILPIGMGLLVWHFITAERHALFTRDEPGQDVLLRLVQLRPYGLFNHVHQLTDHEGQPLGRITYHSLLTPSWECFGPNGELICRVWPDGNEQGLLVLRLLIHLLQSPTRNLVGPLLKFFEKSSYSVFLQRTDKIIGTMNKVGEQKDMTLVDLGQDGERRLDRCLAMALALLVQAP